MKLPSTIYRLIARYHGHGDASFDPVETFEALAEQAMEYIGHDRHLLNREFRAFVDQFDVETNAHESTREVTDDLIAHLVVRYAAGWSRGNDFPHCLMDHAPDEIQAEFRKSQRADEAT